MSRKFLTPIDLTGLEILNVKFQNLASHPTALGEGHVYYNTSDKTTYVYNGTAFEAVGKLLDGTFANRPAAGSDGRLYFATDETEKVLYYDNGTAWTKVGESKTYIDAAIGTGVSTHSALTTGVHGVAGTVVGTTDTQTLTNKTLTTPKINEAVDLTATSTELNILDGATLTTTELNYVDGVTSAIQTQLNDKASTTSLTNHTGASSSVHGVTGAVVGTTDAQTLTNKTLGGDLAAGGNKITGLAEPTSASDAATKSYVDTAVQGIDWKGSVRVATTANVNLSTELENGDVIDGVTLATGNRVLVKSQTNAAQNGIYVVKASGAPDRSTDADVATEVTASFAVFVEEGTANADSGYVLTTDGAVTIGTTELVFTQFTGLGQVIAGTGLTKTGNTLNVGAGTGIVVNADTIAIDTTLVTRKFAASVGNNAAVSFVLTHSFNTRDVTITVFDNSTYAEVFADATHSTADTATIAFAVAPTTNQYRVVIVG